MARLNPTDVLAKGTFTDTLCEPCAAKEGVTTVVTRAEVAGYGVAWIECVSCGTQPVDVSAQIVKATDDVKDALIAVFGNAETGSTGGNCEAVHADLPDGGYVIVTNSDVSLPDGFDLTLGRYDAAGDFMGDAALFEGGHDMVALTAALVAVKGA